MRVLLFSLVLLTLFGALPATSAPAPPVRDPDGYQVIMWDLGGIPANQDLFFQRLRDLHVTALDVGTGEDPRPITSHGFGFYVENIHRIAFLFDREKIYRADRDAYVRTQNKRYLIRKPSLNDPAYLAAAKRDIQAKIHFFAGTKPLLYNLGDECSVTRFGSPMDYDFSPSALAAFREWLKGQYGTLEKLNAEWDTKFPTWDAVLPMTTYEIKDRERGRGGVTSETNPPQGSENYAPWADFRTFMDRSYAEAWRQFRQWAHEADPRTPVGLEGVEQPEAFGGYNLWDLSQVVDWVEPYDIGESHSIFRSFLPAGTPIYATVFEHDAKKASRRLWHLLLNGDRGNIIWCSSDWLDYKSPDLAPRPWTKGFADLFAELRGPAARSIMHAARDRAPIALLYSQPSIQVGWMLDSREDGDTWPNRSGSWDATHSRILRVRSSWCRLIEDLGLQYDFVSSEQILDGTFAKRGYKVLVLPASYAIGDREARAIEAFAKAGGTVLADDMPGLFDAHGKRRAKGVLDDLFGVSHARATGPVQQPNASFVPGTDQPRLAEPKLSDGGDVVLLMLKQRPVGKGRAWYLNVSPIDYAKLRLTDEGGWFRDRLGAIFTAAGVRPKFRVTLAGGPPVGCEVIAYHHGGERYLAVMRRADTTANERGALQEGEGALAAQPAQLNIDLGKPCDGKLLLTGEAFHGKRYLEVTLDPWKPVLVAFR